MTEEQSIFGRDSRVVLMKGILRYLSYLLQAAAIQENFVPRDITGFEPPEGGGIIEGTYACIFISFMP